MSLPPPIPLEEAQLRLLEMAEPLPAEEIAAESSIGRYLAAPLLARRTQPAADLSAMDGYAMRGDDLSGPWQMVGESAAGHPFAGMLSKGQAIRISTGAMMPDGGGGVLLQEEAERDRDSLRVSPGGEATPRHIRKTGFDFQSGDELLQAGIRIGPAQLAVAISGGHSKVSVGRFPTVAVLDSGDELAADPTTCALHQIPASNGAMIAAIAGPMAGRIDRIGPVPDRLDAVIAALERAENCDLIVTSGGVSVGDHDLIRPALEAWGADIGFWRVAIKPGKPLMVARRGRQLIIGLPGNPVSSFVTAFLFLSPLLRKLSGARYALPEVTKFNLATPLPATGNRMEFIRAIHSNGMISPVNEQDSSALAALASSNALILRKVDAPAAEPGKMVEAYLLGNGGIA